MKKLKWTGKELTAYHDGHVTGARKMFDAIHAAMMAIKRDRALEIVEEPKKIAPESAVTSTNSGIMATPKPCEIFQRGVYKSCPVFLIKQCCADKPCLITRTAS